MTNEEIVALLAKANITTATTGGLLNTEQSEKFIQTTVDQSAFLKEIRIEKNIGTARDLDNIGVASRLLHTPTEATAPDAARIKGVTAGKRTLTPVEVMLPYNVSLKWLEENIARAAAEDQLNQEFSRQFSNDLVDLMINGNTSTDSGDTDYYFLKILNGLFVKLAADTNKQVYSRGSGSDWKGTVFPAMLKLLPDKYKVDPTRLVLLTSFDAEQEYREQLADRATGLGDAYLTEKRRAQYQGIEVQPVPTMPYGSTLLTNKQNLAMGFGREISVYRQYQPRTRLVEYTITAKIDTNYVLSDLNVYCV